MMSRECEVCGEPGHFTSISALDSDAVAGWSEYLCDTHLRLLPAVIDEWIKRVAWQGAVYVTTAELAEQEASAGYDYPLGRPGEAETGADASQ